MEIMHAMEVQADEAERTITFHVNLKTPGELDLLSFVHYVEQRFGAERRSVARFWKAPRKPFSSVELRFRDAAALQDAKRLCEDKLTSGGLTIANFREEVKSADYRGAGSQPLLRRIYAAPLPELDPESDWQD